MKNLNYLLTVGLISSVVFATSCSDDDVPVAENEEEIITDVTLTFTPVDGGAAIIAAAKDPDGDGPKNLEIISQIALSANTEYNLSLELENSIEGESITEEIEAEDDEHMFFFAFTNDIFSDPSGDGNIDNREGPVNYDDSDDNGLPVGLNTSWTTGEAATGTFQIVLKHQPGVKSATSTVNDGSSDVNLKWNIDIE